MRLPLACVLPCAPLLLLLAAGCSGGGGGGGSGGAGGAGLGFPGFSAADIRVDTALAPASSTSPAFASGSGGTVYAAWVSASTNVMFSRSTDNGHSWSAPVNVLTTPCWIASAVRICADGTRVYVAWERYGAVLPDNSIQLNSSIDGGLTWRANDVRVDAYATGSGGLLKAACVNTHVYILWAGDEGVGTNGMYVQASGDGGTTWKTTDVRLDPDRSNTSGDDDVDLRAEGTNVYVVWIEDAGAPGDFIALNRSTDYGATWQPSSTPVSGVGDPDEPRIASSVGTVHATWTEEPHVRYARSTDFGVSFGLPIDIEDPAAGGYAFDPQICVSGPFVNVIYNEYHAGAGNSFTDHTRVSHSPDSGSSWAHPAALNGLGMAAGGNPVIRCSGADVFAMWLDFRNDPTPSPYDLDLFGSVSVDSGATWSADLQVNTTPGPVQSEVGSYDAMLDSGLVFAGWKSPVAPESIRCRGTGP